ncbi:MAG: hypothetical protein BGN87_11720 [Rhizobiales bacterium 65-79]|jgi:hypothetical protein|nr:MAG: hypothetical protein BGN87_11720 [Rhizobiales bacterium 65-79]
MTAVRFICREARAVRPFPRGRLPFAGMPSPRLKIVIDRDRNSMQNNTLSISNVKLRRQSGDEIDELGQRH